MKGVQFLLLTSLVAIAASVPLGDSEEGKRLIKTSEAEPAQWLSQDEIWALIGENVNFVDVTDYKFPFASEDEISTKAIPTTIRFRSVVQNLITRLSIPRMENFVRSFSSYYNRHYTSATGLESQKWLLGQVVGALQGYNGVSSVTEFLHTWQQSSVVARIEGTDPLLKSEVVIIGAHQDSINKAGATLAAPGADDNASGSVVCLETLKVLVESGFRPKRTLEFHWYAAEEVGLRGSAAIAQQYRSNGVNVVSMANFDVPGYNVQGAREIGIYTDNVSATLSQFMRLLVESYCTYTWRNRTCGYGCSDHVSWTNAGYPSSFPSEPVFHPQMHTTSDSFANVGFTQVHEFAKLGLGYLVEMAEPSNV